MQSPTPPYLDAYRRKQKRSRLFVDGTYAGVPMRIQRQSREVIREVGGNEVIGMETICFVDWTDLAAPPAFGDAVVLGPDNFTVRSYLLQGDGFARVELDNA